MNIAKERTGTELKLYHLSQKIVEEECGYQLYDVEYISGSSTLRVFIMDPATKTAVIEDCVKVDRGFTPYCETEDWIPSDFVLEVSSPGMYRDLKSLTHFEWAIGQFILCHLDPAAIEGETREQLRKLGALTSLKLRGELKGVTDQALSIETNNEVVNLDFNMIKKANLDPEING